MAQDADLIVVGAGIVGLAHALIAARRGLRVVVIERDAQANGASIRNFGFVTVTGQGFPDTWRRARRAREIWAEVAPLAGIAVHQRGMIMACRRAEALAVAEEFAAGPMGEGCRLLGPDELPAHFRPGLAGALHSPHELRVESREAIPRLAAWIEAVYPVTIIRRCAVKSVRPGEVETGKGVFHAPRVIVCPGTDLTTLFPEAYARRGVTSCKLHMLRLADPGFRLDGPVMSDLGMHRYEGYHLSPSLPALRARLRAEQAAHLENGVHLIVAQGADGSLIVGDSHHYADTPDPFQPEAVDALILDELRQVLAIEAPRVVERWIGVYPSGPEPCFAEAVAPGVRLVSVTSGTGASTAFGLAEEVLAEMLAAKDCA